MTEIPGLFSQRLIVIRHHKGALYYPFIEGLAHLIVEIPVNFISVSVMSVILYFLAGLQKSVEQLLCVVGLRLYLSTPLTHDLHSTYLLSAFIVTLVMKVCFRSIAASSTAETTALAVAGLFTMILLLYSGYAIPPTNIVGALRWISYLSVRAKTRTSFLPVLISRSNSLCGTHSSP